MKRFTTVLRESDAMTARKAVCVAGGERVVVTPLPCRADAPETCSARQAGAGRYVQLDVTAGDVRYGSVVAAVRAAVQAANSAVAFPHDGLPMKAA